MLHHEMIFVYIISMHASNEFINFRLQVLLQDREILRIKSPCSNDFMWAAMIEYSTLSTCHLTVMFIVTSIAKVSALFTYSQKIHY